MNDEVPAKPPDIEYLIEEDCQPTSANTSLVPIVSMPTEEDEQKEDSTDSPMWTLGNMELLINVRINMELKFLHPMSKKYQLWDQVARKINLLSPINATGRRCHSKWRNMLTTYKKVLKNAKATGKTPNWPFYEVLYDAYGDLSLNESTNQTPKNGAGMRIAKDSESKLWQTSDIKSLIISRLQMRDLFKEPDSNKDELWMVISRTVKCLESVPNPVSACKTKWLHLLGTYKKKLDYKETGQDPFVWPYFKLFHEAYRGHIVDQNGDDMQEDRTGIWTHSVIKLLVQTRIEMDKDFKSPKIKKSTLWSRVAENVNSVYPLKITGADCDTKWRNMMGTYRRITSRVDDFGENASSWPYYYLFGQLFDGVNEIMHMSDEDDELNGTSTQRLWTHDITKLLIKTRVEMEDSFQNSKCKVYTLWNRVAAKINAVIQPDIVTGGECDLKWRNLKRTYRNIVSKRINGSDGAEPTWPYFKALDELYEHTSNKVEIEVSYNDNHGYVFEALPDNLTGDEKSEIIQVLQVPTNQILTPVQLCESSSTQKVQTHKRLLNCTEDTASKPEETREPSNVDTGAREEKWLKLMLLDWKRERRERWEEKKKIEKEKIAAINNLTRAILSLESGEIYAETDSCKRRRI